MSVGLIGKDPNRGGQKESLTYHMLNLSQFGYQIWGLILWKLRFRVSVREIHIDSSTDGVSELEIELGRSDIFILYGERFEKLTQSAFFATPSYFV